MKLSGTAALYTQLKELENAVAVTKRQIALAEELLSEAPAKKAVRRKRTPKVVDDPTVPGSWAKKFDKTNGLEEFASKIPPPITDRMQG